MRIMCEIDVLMCDFSGVCILRKLLLKIMLAFLRNTKLPVYYYIIYEKHFV